MFTECEGGPVYAKGATINPKMPYKEKISELHCGDMVMITGHIPAKSRWFSINLKQDLDDHKSNTLLHVSVRFEAKEIVRNTHEDGRWQAEERSGLGILRRGQHFESVILIHQTGYKISFNNKHHSTFTHRLHFCDVDTLTVEGELGVESVLIQRGPTKSGSHFGPSSLPLWPHQQSQNSKLSQDTLAKLLPLPGGFFLEVPYGTMIPGGLVKGRVIYLSILPDRFCKRFAIQFRTDTQPLPDVGFDFVAMFDQKNVICNHQVSGRAGKEMRAGWFPFRRGVHADIILRQEAQELLMSVNGQHFIQYPNRIDDTEQFNIMEIRGDITLTHLRMQ